MSTNTSIEWTERTWNPLVGCRRVSPGCVHCYAEVMAARIANAAQASLRAGRTLTEAQRAYRQVVMWERGGMDPADEHDKALPKWNGRVVPLESALLEPLSWRKPSRIFVNSMSDLFHENVPDKFIDRVFAVMALCPQHTFQVLTKRAERMRAYVSARQQPSEARERLHDAIQRAMDAAPRGWAICGPHYAWPLPNVWLGFSAEDQPRWGACESIARVGWLTWVSIEPMLAHMDISAAMPNKLWNDIPSWRGGELSWVVVGGESGPGARPCDLAWIRSIVRQCKAADVPAFCKQLGANVNDRNDAGFDGDPGDSWTPETRYEELTAQGRQGDPVRIRLRDRKGGDPNEWPSDVRVREWPRVEVLA